MLENLSGRSSLALLDDDLDDDVDRNGPQKAGDRAYEQLRHMIVSLEIEPGATVDEQSLSKRLDLGRTPIREALLRLAVEHLVTIIPRRGTRIAPIDLGELKEVEDLRWNLEALAARWAASRISPRQLEKLERLIDRAEAGDFITTDDWDVEVDRRFHGIVAAATQNRYLVRELAHLFNLGIRLQYASRTQMASVGEELLDYRRIIDALRARDPEAAEAGMRDHLIDTRDRTAAVLGSAVGQFYEDGS
jgi:DNA-binding GntR family transcriptional regulator